VERSNRRLWAVQLIEMSDLGSMKKLLRVGIAAEITFYWSTVGALCRRAASQLRMEHASLPKSSGFGPH
jgi:hypothetical protein